MVQRVRMVGMGKVYDLSEVKRKSSSSLLPSFEVVGASLNEKLHETDGSNYVE